LLWPPVALKQTPDLAVAPDSVRGEDLSVAYLSDQFR